MQPVFSCTQFCSSTTSRFAEGNDVPSSGDGGGGSVEDGDNGVDASIGFGPVHSLQGGSGIFVEGAPASDDNTGEVVGATLAAVAAAVAGAVYYRCCRKKRKQAHGASGMAVRSSATQRPLLGAMSDSVAAGREHPRACIGAYA